MEEGVFSEKLFKRTDAQFCIDNILENFFGKSH